MSGLVAGSSGEPASWSAAERGYHSDVRVLRLAARLALLVPPALALQCLGEDEYACADDIQCRREDESGRCAAIGWCAYEDDTCPSGYRFSEHAGDGAAGVCVEPSDGTGGFGEDATEGDGVSATLGSTGFDPCSDGCDTPPGPCYGSDGACDLATDTCVYPPLDAGEACNVPDPCAPGGTCDGAGNCISDPASECTDPPTPCHEPKGVCDPVAGGCVYSALSPGDACDDGDACTTGETCDAAGACGGGEACPSADPCQIGGCEGGACVFSPMSDGTSCGPTAADRCCGGTCVDISSDGAHCGGCNTACTSGATCQSVAVTTACDPAPADTSGRCTCTGNADCPHGQICRTTTPAANLCAPEGPRDCDGTYVDVQLCPNYCGY